MTRLNRRSIASTNTSTFVRERNNMNIFVLLLISLVTALAAPGDENGGEMMDLFDITKFDFKAEIEPDNGNGNSEDAKTKGVEKKLEDLEKELGKDGGEHPSQTSGDSNGGAGATGEGGARSFSVNSPGVGFPGGGHPGGNPGFPGGFPGIPGFPFPTFRPPPPFGPICSANPLTDHKWCFRRCEHINWQQGGCPSRRCSYKPRTGRTACGMEVDIAQVNTNGRYYPAAWCIRPNSPCSSTQCNSNSHQCKKYSTHPTGYCPQSRCNQRYYTTRAEVWAKPRCGNGLYRRMQVIFRIPGGCSCSPRTHNKLCSCGFNPVNPVNPFTNPFAGIGGGFGFQQSPINPNAQGGHSIPGHGSYGGNNFGSYGDNYGYGPQPGLGGLGLCGNPTPPPFYPYGG